jgi:alcohol dehydrogenase (cytochrome c)
MKAVSLFFVPLLLMAGDVATQRLVSSQDDPANWLMYGRNYGAWRYSPLDQINPDNISRLTPQWIFQASGASPIEATPLVFDGLMFFTGSANHGYAIDLATGKMVWRYSRPVPKGVQGCCGTVNRGFGALGSKLFKVNFEAVLVALDAKTGEQLWEAKVDDFKKGFSTTAAPLIVKNQVIVGISGAEFGTRGFIDSYDADTGKRLWRFHTVAAPGEPGGDTWKGDAWQRGGGSTWVTGSYDPELNLIYWGTGNPGPDMNGDVRPGDNLYTCSMVALDADTGKLKWHFQFTPHDLHDWDATEDPVLVDLTVRGKKVKALLQANRNGFVYALDRTNGKMLAAKPYTKVTWASGLEKDGRPVLVAGQEPSEKGTVSCPGLGGGHNWQPTSFSPQTGLFYFGSTDGCQIYYKTNQQYVEGLWYQLSTTEPIAKQAGIGSVIAIDPATGETKWRFETVGAPSGGMLTTAGGLVFTGDPHGFFMALDARTGKPLWKFQTGGPIVSGPISYRFEGKQFVAVAAGSSLISFAVPVN